MFILYGLVAGLVVGLLAGGRIERLADLRIRWAWLAIAGLAAQVVLFLPTVGDTLGVVAPLVYAGSSAAILAVILANLRVPGLALVAAGAACNVAAILANGGYMPVSAEALASLGWEIRRATRTAPRSPTPPWRRSPTSSRCRRGSRSRTSSASVTCSSRSGSPRRSPSRCAGATDRVVGGDSAARHAQRKEMRVASTA